MNFFPYGTRTLFPGWCLQARREMARFRTLLGLPFLLCHHRKPHSEQMRLELLSRELSSSLIPGKTQG